MKIIIIYFIISSTTRKLRTLVRERQAIRLEYLFVITIGTELDNYSVSRYARDLGLIELKR